MRWPLHISDERWLTDPNVMAAFMLVGGVTGIIQFGLFVWLLPGRQVQAAFTRFAIRAFWPLALAWVVTFVLAYYAAAAAVGVLMVESWMVPVFMGAARALRD